MQQFARIVLGYHGCLQSTADALLSGRLSFKDWVPSTNPYDWLGHGIYFWEHGPSRAWQWAEAKAERERRKGRTADPAVIGAVIQLGDCLDLTDIQYGRELRRTYDRLRLDYKKMKWRLPKNAGQAPDRLLRELDCLIINQALKRSGMSAIFQTVRAPFIEGSRLYPGSGFHEQSHIQLAVRDPACILGVFRPQS